MKEQDTQQGDEIQLKLKRKWQIALRRYIIDNNPSASYAPYFGLPSAKLKDWLELQFYAGMTWENFGKTWNITQRVPSSLFDLNAEDDLKLCWHYINISVQALAEPPSEASQKLLATKIFFETLYAATAIVKCREMTGKIEEIEKTVQIDSVELLKFLQANQSLLKEVENFESDDFARLNKGEDIHTLLMEKEIIKKYGF